MCLQFAKTLPIFKIVICMQSECQVYESLKNEIEKSLLKKIIRKIKICTVAFRRRLFSVGECFVFLVVSKSKQIANPNRKC